MTYKVLSLKWRPQSFNDIVGQDHIVKTLVNAFTQNRIAQGYIFTGPRGVGKTTTARIMAMALNAEGGSKADFDPKSNISREIAEGRAIDTIEIDGASNRGIEEIRSLREQIKFAPMNSKYKVVIIDEVHMLTNQAFNALLRTLEEPPSHGKFIFATTDIHKVPTTIISRCQRFDFSRISLNIISERLKFILESEGINIDVESIFVIAKKADGSMRDALSLLDQTIAFCGNDIHYDQVVEALGLINQDLYFEFTNSIFNKNYSSMIALLSKFSEYGVPASEVLIGMEEHIRNLIYANVDNGSSLLDMNKDYKEKYVSEVKRWEKRDLFRINQVLIDTSTMIRRFDDPYLLLEMTLLKLLEMDKSILIDELLSKDNLVNKDSDENFNKKNTDDIPRIDKVQIKSQKDDFNKESEKNINSEFKNIKNSWNEILESINKIRPSIGVIIEDFYPSSYENNTITFDSEQSNSFNEKLMERGIPLIVKEFSKIFGKTYKVNFINNTKKSMKKNNNQLESNPKDEKVFSRVVDVFDGEILE
mgnify:CR=1 FL=1